MPETEKAVFRIHINGTIDAVWREITKTDEPQKAFFNCQLHTPGLKPGAPIAMRTPSGKFTNVIGEVLECDPPRRYAHTMRFTTYDDPPCKVIYDLKEMDGGVEFTLTCEDIPSGTKTAKDMLSGGNMIINTLKKVVETGKPSFGTRLLYVLFKVLEPVAPKRCRTEHWA